VTDLIEAQIEPIDNVVQQLSALSNELSELQADPAQLAECLVHWRFSTAQTHRLRELLQRYHVLYPQTGLPAEFFQLPRARELLNWLERRIADAPLVY
jgi:hypothetical protein